MSDNLMLINGADWIKTHFPYLLVKSKDKRNYECTNRKL